MRQNNFGIKIIDEVIEKLIDYRGKTPQKTPNGIKLITAKVIKQGRILDGDHEYIADENYDSWMRRGLPKKGDILITTEAPLGEVAQLKTDEKIALAQRVILLRGKRDVVDQNYFFFALQSPFVQAELASKATGTTVSGIKQSELRQVKIPCFSLLSQRRIAAILSAYDDLIENNSRRIKILEEMARMIYQEWFVKFRFPGHEQAKFVESPLGMIPAGWEVKQVKDSIIFNPKISVKAEVEKPYIAMEGLSTNSMVVTITENRKSASGSKFQNEDTLFARITPCLENGKTGYVQCLPSNESIGIGSTEFIVLRSKTLCSEYVYLLARSDSFRDLAIKSMSGASGRQRVNTDCFNDFFIAEPDKQTLLYFQRIAKPLFQEVNMLSKKNEILKQTRDMLLPKLISGEIDVSDLDIPIEER